MNERDATQGEPLLDLLTIVVLAELCRQWEEL